MPNLLAMSFEGELAPSFDLRCLRPGQQLPDGWGIGYYPGGSYLRDPLDVSQLIDYWSTLGLPLHVTLTIPSSSSLDSQARNPATPLASAYPRGWSVERVEVGGSAVVVARGEFRL